MSRRFRNAVVLLTVLLTGTPAWAQSVGGIPEQPDGIEYATPQATVMALRNKPGTVMTVEGGWLIANDTSEHIIWSFPPATDPAYPSIVRRQVYKEGNQVLVKMGIRCGGTKLACDHMVTQFEQMNQRMRERLSHLPGAVTPTGR